MADLTDEAKAEIADAIRILREDGVHIHKSYAAFLKSQEGKTDPPKNDPPKDPSTEGEPPPVKDQKTDPPAKKGIWWGDRAS